MIYLGLDISKLYIDCFVLLYNNQTHHIKIMNDHSGYLKLLEWLQSLNLSLSDIQAACEATNIYHHQIVKFLHSQNIKIAVINPAQIKAYAKLKNKRIKTDKQDAKLIAHYLTQESVINWQPENQVRAQIKSQTRRVEQLVNMITQEKNRQQVADDYDKESIIRTLTFLENELADLKERIAHLIQANEELVKQHKLLTSIVGIGKDTANVLLGALVDLDKYPTAKHLISYLGLSPVVKESGKWKGQRKLSKMGDKYVRKSLYMPARAACLNSKLWRGWFDSHIARGKHPKQVYIMMMVKLVKYAYVCLKTNQPFDKSKHLYNP